MSLHNSFDRTRHLDELLEPLETQGSGVLTPAQRQALTLKNLTGGTAMTAAQLAALAGVVPGTGAASKALVLDSASSVTIPSGGIVKLAHATLAAAGANQAAAAVVVQQISVVTGADGAKGVALSLAGAANGPYIIINDAAASLLVYPVASGDDQINALAVNAAYTMAGGEMAIFVPVSSTQWYTATRSAAASVTPRLRSTVTNAATISAAQLAGRVLFQDASGGSVTMTTRTGTEIAADTPEMRVGDSFQFFVVSNHASNTSTIAGGSSVTLVGSGAVTQLGGSFILIKTAATTFDLLRVG